MTVVGLLGTMLVVDIPIPVVFQVVLSASSVALGVLLSVRAARMFIEVRQGTLTIHGWLRPRVIPVSRVTAVTAFPAVIWRDEFGGGHWSPLWMLSTSRQFGPMVRHNEAGLRQLAQALHQKLTD